MQCFYIKPRRNAAFSSAGFSLCAFFCVLLKSKSRSKTKPKSKPDRLKPVLLMILVVPNIRAAADSQHAQEKRRENRLNSQEQPHGPEKYFAQSFLERAEAAGCPAPRNVRAARKACDGHHESGCQTVLQFYAPQKSPQRNRIAIEARGVAEHLGEKSDVDNMRAHQRKNHAEHHG